jgi:protein O-GlcNAc transferase
MIKRVFPIGLVLVTLVVLPACTNMPAQAGQSEQPDADLAAAVLHNNTGLAHMKRREYAAAKQEFQKAIAIYLAGAGYVNLGTLLWLEGDREGAMTTYRAAIKANPRNELPYYNLANVLKEMGRVDEAVIYYRASMGPANLSYFDNSL